jgi:hypothetical protein
MIIVIIDKPRNVGFRVAMKDNGLEIRNEWIFNNVHTIEDGEQIGKINDHSNYCPCNKLCFDILY